MAMSILPKFLTLKWNISRTIWRIEVGDGSFLCISQVLSFELNFFRSEVPFKIRNILNFRLEIFPCGIEDDVG